MTPELYAAARQIFYDAEGLPVGQRKAKSSLQGLRYSQLETRGDTAAMAVREWAKGKMAIAVSRAAAGQKGQTVTPYRNFRGIEVVGAWRWLPELEMGAVSEITVQEAFAPLGWLRWSL